jgi:hypothetical protein
MNLMDTRIYCPLVNLELHNLLVSSIEQQRFRTRCHLTIDQQNQLMLHLTLQEFLT